jgi:hypothetical protein
LVLLYPRSNVKQLRGGLPRGVTDALNLPGQQHQQQQQQPSQQLQSLADRNRSFSGALRQLQGLGDLLNLLESPQWGQCLCDLDGVSVVGALVVFVRNTDWQQLQQQRQIAPEQQQQQRQRGEHAIQVGAVCCSLDWVSYKLLLDAACHSSVCALQAHGSA